MRPLSFGASAIYAEGLSGSPRSCQPSPLPTNRNVSAQDAGIKLLSMKKDVGPSPSLAKALGSLLRRLAQQDQTPLVLMLVVKNPN